MTRNTVRLIALFTLLGCSLAAQAQSADVHPVVLELFTSNSCSSCPPAYQALARLTARKNQAHPLIRLDEHVDYWNQLDWVDRYSSPQFTKRQWQYANDVFHNRSVYTPQLVIDGRKELIGSREAEARRIIAKLDNSVAPLSPVVTRQGTQLQVHLADDTARPSGKLWFALTQDHVMTHVGDGENAGRTLHENGVVRTLMPAAASDTSAVLPLPAQVPATDLHLVAFVQKANGDIVAAGQQPVPSA